MGMNLLRNRGTNATRQTAPDFNVETAFNTEFASSGESKKDNLVKLLLMGIGIGLLIAYESYNIGQLTAQSANLTARQNALTLEVEQKKPIAEKARAMQAEIIALEKRIQTIKDLSKIRLREIKAIDFIQNVIPEKVWITDLIFTPEKLTLEGGAIADEHLNRFTEALERKTNFRDVILLKSVEQKAKDGAIKVFTITSSVLSTD